MKKVIVITGASNGIGLITANYLFDKGYVVYSLSRSSKDNNINYIKCDVSNEKDVIDALDQIYQKEKRIDVIINNAGIGIGGAVEYTTLDDINKIIDVNLIGTINTCRYGLYYLRKTKGLIINISSVAAVFSIPFQSFYSLTKSAVNTFSEALQMEVKPLGVNVCYVMPGDTKSDFTKNRTKDASRVDEVYQNRIVDSLSKMEKDEINGMNPLSVSKVIYKIINKKNPPLKVTVGLKYKILVSLKKILPHRLIMFILSKMY